MITRTPRGASSLRKSAIAIPSGAAISSAITEVTAVPKRKGAAPKTALFTSQTELVTNVGPKARYDRLAPRTTL